MKTVTLYEPFLTWLLITALALGFSGTLGWGIWNESAKDCHAKNAQLLEQGKQGPLRGCY